MRRLLLVTTFFAATPIVFLFTLIFALSITYHQNARNGMKLISQNSVAYAALPTTENEFSQEFKTHDGRTEAVRQFFAKYHSPLEEYSELVVVLADKHKIDFRLVPAIAMQESNLCKKIASGAANNCWGFGIYGSKRTSFEDYGHGIEVVTKKLAEWKENGLITPRQIMTRYNPNSPGGAWAVGIQHFIDQI